MRNATLILISALVLVLGRSALADESSSQQSAKLDKQIRVTLDYLLYLPPGYEQQESWPLLIFLHGAGERGDDLELVKKHGPPKLIARGKQFPFIVVSPQCPTNHWWASKPLELTALVDEIEAKHKVDKDRIYLTGLSMGGFGTWALAGYTPDRFAAIVPICGGGEIMTTQRLSRMPTWVFHGAKDPVVPLKRSEDMVQGLKRMRNEAKFTVYPEALHDSWTETYANPELYEWLLAQKRKPAAAAGP